MTTANGTYADCGPGRSFSLTIDCFGPGCSGLQTFPGLTCTNSSSDSLSVQCNNNVVCDSPANFTSAFTLKGDNSTANVTENVKTFGSEFVFTEDSEANATYVNETSSNPPAKSGASISLPRLHSKFMIVFFAFMATCISSGFAQSTPLQSLEASLPQVFGSIIQAAEVPICHAAAGLVEGGVIQLTDPAVADALAQLKIICENALWEIEISTGIAEAALAVPLGAGILAIGLGDFLACNKLITEIFLPSEGPLNNAICSAILSNPTTSTTSASPPASSSTSASVTGLAPIPTISATSGPTACIVCLIDDYFSELNMVDGSNFSNWYVPAKYLVRYFCDPSVQNVSPFTNLCTSACQNPCQQYSADAWLSTEPAADETIPGQLICQNVCTGPNGVITSGNCPDLDSQFDNYCSGLCPGADYCS